MTETGSEGRAPIKAPHQQSGIGREGGVEGLLPFLETKTIILDGELRPRPGTARL